MTEIDYIVLMDTLPCQSHLLFMIFLINENKLFNIRREPGIKKIYVEETPSPACISSVSMRWIDLWDELLPDLLS